MTYTHPIWLCGRYMKHRERDTSTATTAVGTSIRRSAETNRLAYAPSRSHGVGSRCLPRATSAGAPATAPDAAALQTLSPLTACLPGELISPVARSVTAARPASYSGNFSGGACIVGETEFCGLKSILSIARRVLSGSHLGVSRTRNQSAPSAIRRRADQSPPAGHHSVRRIPETLVQVRTEPAIVGLRSNMLGGILLGHDAQQC